MPIRADLRHFYGQVWRTVTRPRILARANNHCEQCGKPNRTRVYVWRSRLSGQYWTLRIHPRAHWHNCLSGPRANEPRLPLRLPREACRRIRVVLTIAHLNHTPGDDRDENLRALCQWCHLHHSQGQRVKTRRERRIKAAAKRARLLADEERLR